jgi:sigma-B regulation protein RsbU (phosphoserine phosphatase)
MALKLLVEQGPMQGHEFVLSSPRVVLGRGEDAHIFLNDDRASRHHAEIRRDGERCVLNDLGSKNGTYVNGERVLANKLLAPGDRILIGMSVIAFDPAQASAVGFLEDDAKVQTTSVSQLVFDPDGASMTISSASRFNEEDNEFADPLARLKIVYQYARLMSQCFDLAALAEHILDALFRVAKPDQGVVFLKDAKTGELEPFSSRNNDMIPGFGGGSMSGGGDEKLLVSRSILNRCVNERALIAVQDASSDKRFAASQSIVSYKIRSALCCPLVAHDDVYGVAYVTQSRSREFSEAEKELVTAMSNQAALAIGNVMHYEQEMKHREIAAEMEVARRIHDRLLSRDGFDAQGLSARGWNRQCSAVGGDYYGFFESNGNRLVAIGDSAGHGVGAALMMSTTRAYLVSTLEAAHPPIATLMTRVNRLMGEDTDSSHFASFQILSFAPGGRKMRFVSAGHEPPLLYRKSEDRFIEQPTGGVVLGVLPDFDYEEAPEVDLMPGDRICLFTDGILEQKNITQEEFQTDRLKKAIRASARMDPRAAIDSIVAEVDRYRAEVEQQDDYTLVMIEVK